jgi:hypothetical protein
LGCKKEIEVSISSGENSSKINGASFVASRNPIDISHLQPVTKTHSNWVCFMPFALGFWDSTGLRFNEEHQWHGETHVGIAESVTLAEHLNLQVMVKPQIWFRGGYYTGHFELHSEEDWKEFESHYSRYILDFAALSDSLNIPLFCIGTELSAFIENRPEYWSGLIAEVRKVYSGKLVYAANWDNYRNIPFWKDLDYIGIDAYFPLSNERTPSIDSCLAAWKPIKEEIKRVHEKNQKPVLFTEYGYCSIDYAAKESWNPDNSGSVNLQAQVNAYEALYQTFWNEEWVAGGFFWKWFHNDSNAGGPSHKRFTPQNKPALSTISKYYKKQ